MAEKAKEERERERKQHGTVEEVGGEVRKPVVVTTRGGGGGGVGTAVCTT